MRCPVNHINPNCWRNPADVITSLLDVSCDVCSPAFVMMGCCNIVQPSWYDVYPAWCPGESYLLHLMSCQHFLTLLLHLQWCGALFHALQLMTHSTALFLAPCTIQHILVNHLPMQPAPFIIHYTSSYFVLPLLLPYHPLHITLQHQHHHIMLIKPIHLAYLNTTDDNLGGSCLHCMMCCHYPTQLITLVSFIDCSMYLPTYVTCIAWHQLCITHYHLYNIPCTVGCCHIIIHLLHIEMVSLTHHTVPAVVWYLEPLPYNTFLSTIDPCNHSSSLIYHHPTLYFELPLLLPYHPVHITLQHHHHIVLITDPI